MSFTTQNAVMLSTSLSKCKKGYMQTLSDQISTHTTEVTATLRQFFTTQQSQAETIDPLLAQSVKLLSDFSLAGGKYVRSFLTRIAFELSAGEKTQDLLPVLGSIELHHKHILILDDIADRDERRYDHPTLEFAYRSLLKDFPDHIHRARSFAMLDAVFLGALSKELLSSSDFSPATVLKCLHIFHTTMFRDTLAGWQIHGMGCMQPIGDTSEADFLKGLELVTARYTFTGPLLLGLTLAQNHDHTVQKALEDYALNVGTAFQIQDDILGLFGETKKTGKPVGNDVREGKKTLLLTQAYARGSTTERKLIQAACGASISQDTLKQVQAVVRSTGSLEYSERLAHDYVDRGCRALDALPQSEQKETLLNLAWYCIKREK